MHAVNCMLSICQQPNLETSQLVANVKVKIWVWAESAV